MHHMAAEFQMDFDIDLVVAEAQIQFIKRSHFFQQGRIPSELSPIRSQSLDEIENDTCLDLRTFGWTLDATNQTWKHFPPIRISKECSPKCELRVGGNGKMQSFSLIVCLVALDKLPLHSVKWSRRPLNF